jgi:uncharacterized membrane protein (UPF0127 family)
VRYRLVNARTLRTLATDVEVAMTRESRRRGLLGRDSLDPCAALFLKPCLAIHTAFMRFPLDVVFVDGDIRVVRVVRQLQPWRITASPRARAVIEFRGGALDPDGISLGDALYLAPAVTDQAASG